MINFKILATFLIVVNIILSAYWLFHGDIHYDVDVSRDFLVMNDIVKNNHLTLLGPRSGAIDGIFHGPLWFYINLLIFLIGNGNPIIVGWFWWFLSIFLILIIFLVAKKLFDQKVAFLSILLFSANSIVNPTIGLKNFYNPYGAIFLTPIFFILTYHFITTLRLRYLIFSLFILGLIIQFQMAFGVPILIIITLFLMVFLYKKRKLLYFLSYLALIIPLSTFIIFDFRHDGLQVKAFIQYITQLNSSSFNILNIFFERIRSLIFGCFEMLFPGKNFTTIFYTTIFLLGSFFAYKKNDHHKKIFSLFYLLFLGFWVISLIYKGGIGNYFWPFLPVMTIIFCSLSIYLNQKIFLIIFSAIYMINMYVGISAILDFQTDINKRGPHSWAFNLKVAKELYINAKDDFGYFTFSPDRFAYQQRYAMIYANQSFPYIRSYSSTKKPLTFLIEVDPAPDRRDISSFDWRISDVKIERDPNETYRRGFIQVKKYWLTDEEIRIPSNPYLKDDLFLR